MKKYKEFSIRTEPFLPDLITGIIWELNISGIVENETDLKVYGDETLTKKMISEKLEKLRLEKIILQFDIGEEQFEYKNWNKEWEDTRKVIKVSGRIVIKPSFKSYSPSSGEIVLTIDPKMSFGTGEHQTTRLMLMLIEKYAGKGMKVLDVGSGTAVLAIASVKLGAASAVAIDFDEECLENALENCRVNYAESSVDPRTGEIRDIKERKFDLILANIQKNVLQEIAPEVFLRLKKGGLAILSGLLKSDEEQIENTYKSAGFGRVEKLELDEWIAVVYRRV